MEYYLELLDNEGHPSGQWEEVDEFIFSNRKDAVQDNDLPRYGKNYAVLNGGSVKLHIDSDVKTLGHFARLVGAQLPTGATNFCSSATQVLVKGKGKCRTMYNVATRSIWREVTPTIKKAA